MTISGNDVSRVFQVDSQVTATITGLTIAGGSNSGGGVYNAGTATLSECTVSGNSGFAGGGLYNRGTMSLTECTVGGNSGAGSGGGLFNRGTANLTACTFSGNSTSGASGGNGGGKAGIGNSGAGIGGAMFNHGTADLVNCTIGGNTANNGTGLFNYGAASLISCTVTRNSGGYGIYDYSYNGSNATVTMTNSIVWNNAAALVGYDIDLGAFPNVAPGGFTGSYDLIGYPGPSGLINGQDGNLVGIEDGVEPVLSPLGDYGGPTQTIALLPGCSAIGSGIAVQGVTADQRGAPLDSPHPDIGAFQSHGFDLKVVAGSTPQSTGVDTAFANPLAVTVTAKDALEPVAGGLVNFVAPSGGASAVLPGLSINGPGTAASIGSDGVAGLTPTANATYGTALSSTQLDATVSVLGTFTYTPAAGTILDAGAGQTLSVAFAPDDSTDYTTASGTARITVTQATPTITWPDPTNIIYSTALSNTQLDATASVPGTFAYTPAVGTILKAGAGPTLSVAFAPTDSSDYTDASATAMITVTQATPTMAWPDPADITYGTALSATQLDATASVPGTFAYTPAAGAILDAGAGQTLSVAFTPTDSSDYTDASVAATITVAKAAPTITWADPATITYGTALSSTQLNATGSVPGKLTYTPPAGSGLKAGTDQTLSVSLTPTDTVDYATATATVMIDVDQAMPTMTWTNPAAITYGTALSGTQLDATSSVPGTLSYTPAVGTVLTAGAGQTLSVLFKPNDKTDYATATATATIDVDQATPTITWANPLPIAYGTILSATQLDATASVAGTLTYSPAEGTLLNTGLDQTLSVSFTPTDTTDYTTATAMATINVDQAAPTITWAGPADIAYGTALSGIQLDAAANVLGTFQYTPVAGTILGAGNDRTLTATFTPSDSVDYVTRTVSTTITVEKATPTLKLSDPGGQYDSALFAASVTVAGVGSDSAPSAMLEGLAPTLTYYSGAGTTGPNLGSTAPAAVGTYTVVASFAGSADYGAVQSAPVTFTISAGTDAISLSVSTSSSDFGEPVTLVARVTSSVTPGGTVTFFNGGASLGTVPLNSSGEAVLTTSDLVAGSHAVTATYSGDADLPGATSGSAIESVSKSGTTFGLVPVPVLKKKKIKSEILTARLEPISPGGGVPTGTVIFELLTKKKTVTKTLGTAVVNDGAGTLTLKPTKVLGKAITIVYSGDANFEASTLAAPKLSKKGLL